MTINKKIYDGSYTGIDTDHDHETMHKHQYGPFNTILVLLIVGIWRSLTITRFLVQITVFCSLKNLTVIYWQILIF